MKRILSAILTLAVLLSFTSTASAFKSRGYVDITKYELVEVPEDEKTEFQYIAYTKQSSSGGASLRVGCFVKEDSNYSLNETTGIFKCTGSENFYVAGSKNFIGTTIDEQYKYLVPNKYSDSTKFYQYVWTIVEHKYVASTVCEDPGHENHEFCSMIRLMPYKKIVKKTVQEFVPDEKNSVITATIEPAVFNCTVPTTMPITIKADGTVVSSDSVSISNSSTFDVVVNKLDISSIDDWKIHDFNDPLYNKPVDSKMLGISITGTTTVNTDSSNESNQSFALADSNWSINANDKLDITYNCTSAPTTESGSIGKKFNIVFTLDWKH